jgi:hypothetical protein
MLWNGGNKKRPFTLNVNGRFLLSVLFNYPGVCQILCAAAAELGVGELSRTIEAKAVRYTIAFLIYSSPN